MHTHWCVCETVMVYVWYMRDVNACACMAHVPVGSGRGAVGGGRRSAAGRHHMHAHAFTRTWGSWGRSEVSSWSPSHAYTCIHTDVGQLGRSEVSSWSPSPQNQPLVRLSQPDHWKKPYQRRARLPWPCGSQRAACQAQRSHAPGAGAGVCVVWP